VEAARRVLVDLGHVLASFSDCMVVVGGWTPDLLMPKEDEPHVGSIDVDLALDAAKLNEGRYADPNHFKRFPSRLFRTSARH
jgi:hypothetical protein